MNGAPPTSAPKRAGTFPFVVAPVLAHQGGWDEALLVATPLAVIGGLLWLANRRVQAQLDEQTAVQHRTGQHEPEPTQPEPTQPEPTQGDEGPPPR